MGAQTSKTLVIEEKNLREFQDITTEMRTAAVKAARLSAVYVPLVLFCGSLATAIVLGRGGQMVQENLLAIGTLSAFTSYAVGIFEPIQQLARNLAELISIQANIERVNTLLDQEPMVVDSPKWWSGTAIPSIRKRRTGSPSGRYRVSGCVLPLS